MITIVYRFTHTGGKVYQGEVEMQAVPRTGDKVVINSKHDGFVAEVVWDLQAHKPFIHVNLHSDCVANGCGA